MPKLIVPTHEWQTIEEGQSIPPGCHVRMCLNTGKQEVRLLRKEESDNSLASALLPVVKDKQISAVDNVKDSSGSDPGSQSISNWKGLLNWSLRHSDETDPTRKLTEMDLERRNWLKEALESNLSESKKMAELLNIIFEDKDKFYSLEFTEEELQMREDALESLCEYVYDLNNAIDLMKMGGLLLLLDLLDSKYPSIQWRAADVIAVSLQNNSTSQDYAVAHGFFQRILALLDCDSPRVQTKAIFCLSALVKGNKEAGQLLCQRACFSHLLALIASSTSENMAFLQKALGLLEYTYLADLLNCEFLVEQDVIELLPSILSWSFRASNWPLAFQALRLLSDLAKSPAGKEKLLNRASVWHTLLVDFKRKVCEAFDEESEAYEFELLDSVLQLI